MRRTLRLARTDLFRALGSYRWLVAVPVWFTAAWLVMDSVRYDYRTGTPRPVNLWDAPPALLDSISVVLFVFVLGFVFLTGDLYVRDRTLGVASTTMLRVRSRGHWWGAKLGALGGLSLVYSTLAFSMILLVGTVRLGWNEGASVIARQATAGDGLYPRWGELPMPVFVLVLMLYIALALWIVGAVVLLISTLLPHPLTPAVTGLGWVLLDSPALTAVTKRTGWGRVDPMYQVFYSSHFGPSYQSFPWTASFAVIGVTLAATAVLGAWRLRHTDL